MSGISWWRSWHGAPTDHKWAVIAVRSGVKVGIVSAIAWALLDYASQQQDRGSIAGFDPEEYAVYSGFEEVEIVAVLQAMTDKGIITNGRLTNWEKRQPKREDDSTERVRKYRAEKRNVTQCNADDDAVTPQIKIKETDKETEEEHPQPPNIFTLYEREIGIITPAISEKIKLAEAEYPAEWFGESFKEAAAHNKRSWAYCEAILKGWKEHGFRAGKNNNGNGGGRMLPKGV